MTDTVVLIDGVNYSGWQRMVINRSLFELASTIELEVAEGWQGDQRLQRIKPGAAFEVLHRGELVLAGYLDGRNIEYDSQSHSVQLIGRDFGADLVDCSAYHPRGEWTDTTLQKVLADISRGFVQGVLAGEGVDLQQKVSFALEGGEMIADAIHRLLSRFGYVPRVDSEQRLNIVQTGVTTARPLTLGRNVLRGSLTSSVAARYYSYRVQSELNTTAWSGKTIEKATKPVVEVIDDLIRKPRRLLIWEEFASETRCRKRAEHERAVRTGKGDSLTYTVPGWTQDTGGVWPVNALVPVNDPYMDIDTELLIVASVFTLEENGHQAELQVMNPDVLSAPVAPVRELQGTTWNQTV